MSPRELLDEVRSFARRKPGMFLLGAAAAGMRRGPADPRRAGRALRLRGGSGRGRYRAQTNYVDPDADLRRDQPSTYTGTGAALRTTGSAPLPPPPYGTVPPAGSVVLPTTPAGWDDPTRRPGGVG